MSALGNTRYKQLAAVLSATLMSVSITTLASWPSPTLPLLVSEDSPIGVQLTNEEGAWIVSIPLLGSIPCAFVCGWLLDKFGRKCCLLASAVPMVVLWVIVLFARSFLALCVARALGGISIAFAMVGGPTYVSEIADNDIRGQVGIMVIAMAIVGNLLVLGIGPFISYVALALISLAIPVAFFVIFVFMPESPYYLVKVGKVAEAKDVLVRLSPANRESDFVEKKIQEIGMSIEKERSNSSSMSEIFIVPEYRKALFISLGLKTLYQCSGTTAIGPYLQTIMELSGSAFPPQYSSIIFGVIPIPAVMVSVILVDRLGRKPLLIFSASGCAVGLFAEGAYFFSKDVWHENLDDFSWLPTTALVLSIFLKSLGLSVLPFVILSEIFSTNVRGIAMSIGVCYSTILGFLLAKYFPIIAAAYGMHSMFWFFAASCVLGSVFVFFCVPETKGKPFAEIQRKLRRVSKVVELAKV